jgi:hypothetical protein
MTIDEYLNVVMTTPRQGSANQSVHAPDPVLDYLRVANTNPRRITPPELQEEEEQKPYDPYDEWNANDLTDPEVAQEGLAGGAFQLARKYRSYMPEGDRPATGVYADLPPSKLVRDRTGTWDPIFGYDEPPAEGAVPDIDPNHPMAQRTGTMDMSWDNVYKQLAAEGRMPRYWPPGQGQQRGEPVDPEYEEFVKQEEAQAKLPTIQGLPMGRSTPAVQMPTLSPEQVAEIMGEEP